MREEQSIIQWCRDNLVNLDRQKYEKEEQARLKEVMKAMDNMEAILQEQKEQMISKSIKNKNKTEGKEGN